METIETIKTVEPKVKPKRKIRKILFYGVAFLVAILFVGDWLWVRSGSGEWELLREKDGIKIWTLKTPGTGLRKIKINMQVKTNLAGMIKLIEDPTSGPDVGAKKVTMLESKISPSGDYSAYYECLIDLPFPFSDRQGVILILHSQDPVSKKIVMNVFAAPNRLPPNESYVRPTHTHNIWHLTPRENGMVDIEYFQDSYMGGSVPYYVNNVLAPVALHKLFSKFQDLMNKEKFKNAKFDYIKEL